MARPHSWYELNEFAAAKRAAKERKHSLWKFTRHDRNDKKIQGYFVGAKLPVKLRWATVEERVVPGGLGQSNTVSE